LGDGSSHPRDIPSPEEQDDHPFHATGFGTPAGEVSSGEQDDPGQVSPRAELGVDHRSLRVSSSLEACLPDVFINGGEGLAS
jgi:hypothetical protein